MLTVRGDFRSEFGAAPLKHVKFKPLVNHVDNFRSEFGAAPLKRRKFERLRDSDGTNFRSEFGAAPLKLLAEIRNQDLEARFPLRIRSGPVEANALSSCADNLATFPLRIRSGPVEA